MMAVRLAAISYHTEPFYREERNKPSAAVYQPIKVSPAATWSVFALGKHRAAQQFPAEKRREPELQAEVVRRVGREGRVGAVRLAAAALLAVRGEHRAGEAGRV